MKVGVIPHNPSDHRHSQNQHAFNLMCVATLGHPENRLQQNENKIVEMF